MTPDTRKKIARRIRDITAERLGKRGTEPYPSCCVVVLAQLRADPSYDATAVRRQRHLCHKYITLFSPAGRPTTAFWLDGHFDSEESKRLWRMTALLLFADMLEAGDA